MEQNELKIGIQMWSIHNVCKELGFAKAFELVSKNRAAVHKGMDVSE